MNDNDEHVFFKKKSHHETKCPKLLRENKKKFKSSYFNVVVNAPITIDFDFDRVYPNEAISQMFDIKSISK